MCVTGDVDVYISVVVPDAAGLWNCLFFTTLFFFISFYLERWFSNIHEGFRDTEHGTKENTESPLGITWKILLDVKNGNM